MKISKPVALILCCLFQFPFVSGCGADPIPRAELSDPAARDSYCEHDLRAEVEKFSEGEGNESVLAQLASCPREALIKDLKRLRDDAAKDDSIRLKIAFLFCRLDHEVNENQRIVEKSMTRRTQFPGFNPDDVISMIGGLIRAGNKDLISTAVDSLEWSDGAVTEVILEILTDEILTNPETVLEQLAEKNQTLRQKAFELVVHTSQAPGRREQLIKSLETISSGSRNYPSSKNLLRLLRSVPPIPEASPRSAVTNKRS